MKKLPKISVLITTFNREVLLRRSIQSVIDQDYPNIELVIIDDASTDNTEAVVKSFNSDIIRYIKNPQNLGKKYGDRILFQKFIYEYSTGEYCIYLCDDDYWLPNNLLSRQIDIFLRYETLSAVIGGMAQVWPTPIEVPPPSPSVYWWKERISGIENATFNRNIYPNGFITSNQFLFLFSSDIANRNILTGASLYKRSKFIEAGIFNDLNGSKWQAGYELTAGIATVGDIYYLDEPCVIAEVDINSASYRGTQYEHLVDCLNSIAQAFKKVRLHQNYRNTHFYEHENRMKHSVLMTYVRNQLTFKLGFFDKNPLQGITRIFAVPITLKNFLYVIFQYKIRLSGKNIAILLLCLLPKRIVGAAHKAISLQLPNWIADFSSYKESATSNDFFHTHP